MATPEKQVLEQLYEAKNKKDPAAIRGYLADNFEYIDPNDSYGPDKYVSNFMDTAGPQGAFPMMEFKTRDMVQEGNVVVVEWMARAVHDAPVMGIPPPPGGAPVMLGAFSMFTVEGGKVTKMKNSFGNQGLLEALRFVPPMPMPPQ